MAVRLKGWRYGLFIGGLVGLIGLFVVPSMIMPLVNPEPYKRVREQTANKLPPKPTVST